MRATLITIHVTSPARATTRANVVMAIPANVVMPTHVTVDGATHVTVDGATHANVDGATHANVAMATHVTVDGRIRATALAGSATKLAEATHAVGSALAIPVRIRTTAATTCATAHGASIQSVLTTTSAIALGAHLNATRCVTSTTHGVAQAAQNTILVIAPRPTHANVDGATPANAVMGTRANVDGVTHVTAGGKPIHASVVGPAHVNAMRIVIKTARATLPIRQVLGTMRSTLTTCSLF
jgi:hypothetical protein